MEFSAGGAVIHGEVLDQHFHGRRTVKLWTEHESFEHAVDTIGHVPLPPYIKREDHAGDHERDQTVFAQRRGSIAAPTAGLHFTTSLLEAILDTRHRGHVNHVACRLRNVPADPGDIDRRDCMQAEEYEVSAAAAAVLSQALADKRRIIAVGTTTGRTLESLTVGDHGQVQPGRGSTDLFIYPGHTFRLVSGLVTNFDLPKLSLLVLVAAFSGRAKVLNAYRHAIAHRYRFYSYGDAMLILCLTSPRS